MSPNVEAWRKMSKRQAMRARISRFHLADVIAIAFRSECTEAYRIARISESSCAHAYDPSYSRVYFFARISRFTLYENVVYAKFCLLPERRIDESTNRRETRPRRSVRRFSFPGFSRFEVGFEARCGRNCSFFRSSYGRFRLALRCLSP